MDGDALPASAQLQAWRTRGAERMDPLRFAFLDALATRMQAHAGEARHLLDARLTRLIGEYASDLAEWTPPSSQVGTGSTMSAGGTALHALVTALQQRAPMSQTSLSATDAPPGQAPAALAEARRVWTQVRTDSQLRASLDDLPGDAGPLNSGKLVHRALHFMREVSPGYLQHFIAYTDTLSSLERLQQDLGPLAADGADSGKPASRTRNRKRRS
ncbi:DUF2894 domain-containing protein [Pseudoxanthomonas sp. LH2527]|uniref:DUF2894 domain-containing protein n=1 Tax=Pseudoxanthomonas sp. LH2527 TaxID=2923249 RepID=UPI001F13D6E2|nr:DUF2894 domain-containing protein [Pseudoxanthomonas sp. LH2527]MCH6482056.1 DUF2894 domain-containing protein [Pseudoxanthomonas sp. LH2527]